MFRAFFYAAAASLALSCASPASPTPFDLSVSWGLTGASALPDGVEEIAFELCFPDETGMETCQAPSTCTLAALTLTREDGTAVEHCRPSQGTEEFGEDPVLVLRDLPSDSPIRIRLSAQSTAGATFVGHAGPFVLGEGQRRFVHVEMYEADASTPLPSASLERVLHTTTHLPDGRLLVAGGFAITTMPSCPEERMLPEGTACFDLTATREAVAIDVGSAQVETIRNPMLTARGGHTATPLPDGRVLIAGGAEGAFLAMVPRGGPTSGLYTMQLEPREPHQTFEIFDAYLGGEENDLDRDGDFGRGEFLGAAGSTTLGTLNAPRFMHAAAAVPTAPDTVVLVGGMGSDEAASSWEVFDARRPGGYGVYDGSANALAFPRPMPGAVGTNSQVWILGGGLATSNDDLAEVWQVGTDPNGAVTLATDTDFPNSAPMAMEVHPEYSLLRPLAATIDGGRVLVIGWYGAQCEPMTTSTRFVDGATPTEFCDPPTSASRSYTVDPSSGRTAPTPVETRSFGAIAQFEEFDGTPSHIVATGGIANAAFATQSQMDFFDGQVDTPGAAQRVDIPIGLRMPRFFHTSTSVPGLGLVTVGGITSSAGGGLRPVATIEVLYLDPA